LTAGLPLTDWLARADDRSDLAANAAGDDRVLVANAADAAVACLARRECLLLQRFGRAKPGQLQELRRAVDDDLGLGVRRRSAK
jgi:hypothetical protein